MGSLRVYEDVLARLLLTALKKSFNRIILTYQGIVVLIYQNNVFLVLCGCVRPFRFGIETFWPFFMPFLVNIDY